MAKKGIAKEELLTGKEIPKTARIVKYEGGPFCWCGKEMKKEKNEEGLWYWACKQGAEHDRYFA